MTPSDWLAVLSIAIQIAGYRVRRRRGPDGPASTTAQPGGSTAYSAFVTGTRRCPTRTGVFQIHHSTSPPTPRSSVTAARSSRPGAAISS